MMICQFVWMHGWMRDAGSEVRWRCNIWNIWECDARGHMVP